MIGKMKAFAKSVFTKDVMRSYINETEIVQDIVTLCAIIYHIYIYQTLDKSTELNPRFIVFVILFLICILINDFLTVLAQIKSRNFIQTHISMFYYVDQNQNDLGNGNYFEWRFDDTDAIYTYYLPLLNFIMGIVIFWPFSISGYKKIFFFYKYFYLTARSLRIPFSYYTLKIINQIMRYFEPYFITWLMLISMTDPQVDDEVRNNRINHTEIFMRFMETYCLILGYFMIHSYNLIDKLNENKKITTSTVIGKYDTFRYCVLLIIFHYYFTFINSLAYSFKYSYGFGTIFVACWTINKFMKKDTLSSKKWMMILIALQLMIYTLALFLSAPNEGDGSIGHLASKDTHNETSFTNINLTSLKNEL